ncbi:MAG TPA: DUF6703 family protein [Segeticoccus sp.]|uniref:DUF6703 family protein n=1 Tax=Segeticoccus sp. TaxID=2706531 RepID=UPI002D800A12|nr:DUF6703 family protein [Segeticoccus sp.]HET8600482.1 DUF6703 family protein [Segeticoccus sp.]
MQRRRRRSRETEQRVWHPVAPLTYPHGVSATSRPASPGLRGAVERASMPLLTRLSRLPRVVPFLSMLALLLVGAFLGGPVGVVLVAVAALFLAWLLYLAWPKLGGNERLMRLAVIALVVAVAVVQLVPKP